MNIQVDPTSSNVASAMLNSKIRPRAVVGYGVKIFHPSPPNYVTRSPGCLADISCHLPCFCNVPTKLPKYINEKNVHFSHFDEELIDANLAKIDFNGSR